MYQNGNIVKEKKYGYTGMVVETFVSWNDLKTKQQFVTIDPDDESEKMDAIEKIINGDPKDAWLNLQEIPFTIEQLNEKWYTIRCFSGGAIWTCESMLTMVDIALN